jgi:cell division transport system permease protein
LASLDALGRNPLLAHLNVKAKDPNDYARIAEFLSGETFSSVFASIDFYDRAPIIERLSRLISGMRAVVAGVIAALSAIAVLVAFNTIRLTIYSSKGEIEIMRLVGASNWFIRGPFLVQGAFVGLVSSFAALTLLVLAGFFLSGSLRTFTGFDVSQFLLSQFFLLFFLLLVVGVGLGFAASTIAINRYLKA